MEKPKRFPFTEQEDNAIRECMKFLGEDWESISERIPGRSAKQIRDRYINYLKEGLKTEPWTNEEDEILIEMFKNIGPKWSKMMSSLPGRSSNDIKNRWHKRLFKKILQYNAINNPQFFAMQEIYNNNFYLNNQQYYYIPEKVENKPLKKSDIEIEEYQKDTSPQLEEANKIPQIEVFNEEPTKEKEVNETKEQKVTEPNPEITIKRKQKVTEKKKEIPIKKQQKETKKKKEKQIKSKTKPKKDLVEPVFNDIKSQKVETIQESNNSSPQRVNEPQNIINISTIEIPQIELSEENSTIPVYSFKPINHALIEPIIFNPNRHKIRDELMQKDNERLPEFDIFNDFDLNSINPISNNNVDVCNDTLNYDDLIADSNERKLDLSWI